MRALAFLLLATPAAAWEASSEGPVCLLTKDTDEAEIVVSHDPRKALPYAIDLTLDAPWQAGPFFAIRFDGLQPRTITTDRHQLTRNTLTVTDRGFGNVLDGLAFNFVALAASGSTSVVIPLEGAAPEVEKFKACATAAGV